ncbi:MAG TPA: hypothetical protein VMD09_04060 [Solirubrobacteraceae bacterium]|nr:hypothetical protein [Solirubrobacteraceae bacterium]
MSSTPVQVKLGEISEGGVAPAIMAIVDRGVAQRPELAGTLQAEVELNIEERYPPVRIVFDNGDVLVEDGSAQAPDLRVTGTLPDLVSLMVAPLVGGLPNPMAAKGRAVLGMVAQRRVKVEGRVGLLRRFLGVIRI